MSSLSSTRQPVRWLLCLALIRISTFKEMKDFIKDYMIVSSRTNARSRRARLEIPARNFPLHIPATTEWGPASLVQGFLLKIQSYYDSKCWEELEKARVPANLGLLCSPLQGAPTQQGDPRRLVPTYATVVGVPEKVVERRGHLMHLRSAPCVSGERKWGGSTSRGGSPWLSWETSAK